MRKKSLLELTEKWSHQGLGYAWRESDTNTWVYALREWEILCGVIGMWKEWQQWIEKALSLNLLEQRCKTNSEMQGTHFSERRWGWLVLRSWQVSRKMVNPIPVGSTNHPQTSAGGKEKVMTLFLTKPCPYLWTWWHFLFFSRGHM